MVGWDSYLYLEKGHLFEGMGFGAETSHGGEAGFNTGMSGYQEIFTDPSYFGQVVVMTYPHLGNTGVNNHDKESSQLFLSGVVAREYCENHSSWRATSSLHDYLKANQVPGISEVDTRRVTTLLRDEGAQRAVIFSKRSCGNLTPTEYAKQVLAKVPEMEGLELVSKVSCKAPYDFKPKSEKSEGTIVVYDYGVKTNILRIAASYPYHVRVVPYQTSADEVLALKPRAVMLSNGPGDPEMVQGATEQIQSLIGKVPIFAICMGHQLLGRALGCKTYKLKFGHHGINHPVKDLMTNRILITSQNHGFAIKADDLKQKEISLSHVSLNDNTVEGFFSEKLKLMSIQFHPEAKPGPNDSGSLFETFVRGLVQ